MNVSVALEVRYFVTPDGQGWTPGGMALKFWERYLDVFDRVRIVARAVAVEKPSPAWVRVTGDSVSLHPLPNYLGPWEYLKRSWAVRSAIRMAVPRGGAVILRAPSQVGACLERPLRERNYPYALEVVGDPYEVCAPGVLHHPLRPIFRWWFTRELRRQCQEACAVAYVTRYVLQRRYPAREHSAGVSDVDLPLEAISHGRCSTSHYSSIELDPAGISHELRRPKDHGPYEIVTVGSLSQMYKGPDVLLRAAAQCVRQGLDLKLTFVGDGKFRQDLAALTESLGLGSRTTFCGLVPAGEAIRRILDSADLFVLPSRTEGLPRALIEAMARGLPCLASNVGGIPELLDAEDLVPPSNPAILATQVAAVLRDPTRMAAMSRRNLLTSLSYRESILAERRRSFYQYVRDCTREWEARR